MQNNQTNGIQTITQETTITENVSYTQQEYARVEAAVYKQIGITKFGPFILQSALIMAVIAVMIVSLIYTIKVTEYRQITRIETEEMTTTTSNKMIIGGSKKGETEPRTELSEEEVNSYLFEGEPIIVMSDAYLKMQETEEYIYLLDDLELKRVRKSDYAVERIMRGPLNIVVGSEERMATVYDFAVIQNDIYILVDPLMDCRSEERRVGKEC